MEAGAWYWYAHPQEGYLPVQLKWTKPQGHILITPDGEVSL